MKKRVANDCVFCKIVAGEIPSETIWEDEKHKAILSIFPNTEGFTVVLTKEHYPSYAFKNTDDVLRELMLASKKVGLLIDSVYKDVGRTGMILEGFGVDHLHSKLFPMHGTGNIKKWKPLESGNKMKTYFDKYPGYISSHDSDMIDKSKLKSVASKFTKKKK